MKHSKKGWLMLLSAREKTHLGSDNWGTVEKFYEGIEEEGEGDIIELESDVWGKIVNKDLTPQPGDGIAFYHTMKAKFPDPDPYKGRPRISLIGNLLDVKVDGQEVKWMKVSIRRKDMESLRHRPIIRDEKTENLFRKCGMKSGPLGTYFQVPAEVWAKFLEMISAK